MAWAAALKPSAYKKASRLSGAFQLVFSSEKPLFPRGLMAKMADFTGFLAREG
jgi:hypothetical protein